MNLPYQTLLEPVYRRAKENPDRPVFHFVASHEEQLSISAERFCRDMLVAASALRAAGIQKGDVVVLVLRQSWELVAAMYGAMALGAIPSVYTYLSPRIDLESYLTQVRQLVEQADARLVVTLPDYVAHMEGALSGLDCRAWSIAGLFDDAIEPAVVESLPVAEPDDIALLQYSSGTTGLQKGVVFTHRKVLIQVRHICRPSGFDVRPDDVIVTWLPMHHDMGLIANLLCSVVGDIPLVMMSPMRWMRRPILLLQTIAKYDGSIVAMPNFGFSHMTRVIKQEQLAGIDCKKLRILLSGGEPARWDTFAAFHEHFKECGVRPEMFMVGYGLAELVCAIVATPVPSVPRVDRIDQVLMQTEGRAVPVDTERGESISVVSCGTLFPGVEVKIIDEHGQSLGERCIGEVVTRSDFVFDGYHRQPEQTARVLKDGWLYTGDYGYLADGELYICGRKKDMMIIGGKNVFPSDVEIIAGKVNGVRRGRVVAFGIDDDIKQTESAVLVCEVGDKVTEAEQKRLEKEIRRRVGSGLDIALFDIRLVGKGWVMKSSSGKLARARNRQKYLAQYHGREA